MPRARSGGPRAKLAAPVQTGCSDGAPVGESPQDAGGETPSFEDYNRERSVYAAENPTYREGQVAFNVLQDMRSDLTIHAYGNYFDPYYVDTLLPEFLEWVEANWEKKT